MYSPGMQCNLSWFWLLLLLILSLSWSLLLFSSISWSIRGLVIHLSSVCFLFVCSRVTMLLLLPPPSSNVDDSALGSINSWLGCLAIYIYIYRLFFFVWSRVVSLQHSCDVMWCDAMRYNTMQKRLGNNICVALELQLFCRKYRPIVVVKDACVERFHFNLNTSRRVYDNSFRCSCCASFCCCRFWSRCQCYRFNRGLRYHCTQEFKQIWVCSSQSSSSFAATMLAASAAFILIFPFTLKLLLWCETNIQTDVC